MKTVNRAELLALLEAVSHGLSPRDIIEQSSCFVFEDGEVMTYNDEVACRAKTTLKLTGAVQAKSLMSILAKMPEDEVKLEEGDGELTIYGKRRKSGVRMENEVILPFSKNVERPKKFKDLHENFIDAITMAQECTGKDENKFATTCVNIHPKWIEATDKFQITRYRLKTGIEEPTLVRGQSIKSITTLDMKEFCETENWIHFRNNHGLIISCRKWTEKFNSRVISQLLKVSGRKTTFPKGLVEATERAEVFSSENVGSNQVKIILSSGKIRIRGDGVSGWFTEAKKIKYKGPKMEFLISPKLLMELTRRHNECEVSESHLKVNGGRYIYVAVLAMTGEPDNEQEDQEDQELEGEDRGE